MPAISSTRLAREKIGGLARERVGGGGRKRRRAIDDKKKNIGVGELRVEGEEKEEEAISLLSLIAHAPASEIRNCLANVRYLIRLRMNAANLWGIVCCCCCARQGREK